MKKADKCEITIHIHKKIRITKKMVIIFVIVLLTLIMSNCSSETLADIVRLLISIVSN